MNIHEITYGTASNGERVVIVPLSNSHLRVRLHEWPVPGSADTELGVLMEPEVCHGETEVYAGVQA
jgi:hypothetical protein